MRVLCTCKISSMKHWEMNKTDENMKNAQLSPVKLPFGAHAYKTRKKFNAYKKGNLKFFYRQIQNMALKFLTRRKFFSCQKCCVLKIFLKIFQPKFLCVGGGQAVKIYRKFFTTLVRF
eukprot:TRINITY_DN6064_c1_g1_i2.p1 TRINITY_DN6064_c1_g1~~TRINITY_DN6064_c1_g1_i2.p1  ORF type:complete len:118 (-),score=7.90 TRINITY_DN6064_c1_g1_i2:176-529(-)